MFSRFGSRSTIGKDIRCTIRLLDDSSDPLQCEFQKKHTGQYLLDYVCDHLGIREKDIFGLRFMDSDKCRYWLDPKKPILRQIKVMKNSQLVFSFRVKFYPSDPTVLRDDITRYQLSLQLKRDLLHGRLYCPQKEAALLGAYMVQADIGPYDPEDHQEGYVSQFKLFRRQTAELEDNVAREHAKLGDMVPAEAEMNFLKRAVEIETYGVEPFELKDVKNGGVLIGMTFRGILGYKNNRKVYHITWDKVQDLDYVGRDFYVMVDPSALQDEAVSGAATAKRKITFSCPSGIFCKYLWKYALDQKNFFTTEHATDVKDKLATRRLFSRKSTFRFSARHVFSELKDQTLPPREDLPKFQRAKIERQASRSDREPPWMNKSSTLPSRAVTYRRDWESKGYQAQEAPDLLVHMDLSSGTVSPDELPSPMSEGEDRLPTAASYYSDVNNSSAYEALDGCQSRLMGGCDAPGVKNEMVPKGTDKTDPVKEALLWNPPTPNGDVGDGDKPKVGMEKANGVAPKVESTPQRKPPSAPMANGNPPQVKSTDASKGGSLAGRCMGFVLGLCLFLMVVTGVVAFLMETRNRSVRGFLDRNPAVDTFRHSIYDPGRAVVFTAWEKSGLQKYMVKK